MNYTFVDWFIWWIKNMEMESIQLICYTLWHIWKDRCNEVFRRQGHDSAFVLHQAYLDVTSWRNSGLLDDNETDHNSKNCRQETKWSCPSEGDIKINVDAAVYDYGCYTAVIARDNLGCCLMAKTNHHLANEAGYAEALGVKDAILLAMKFDAPCYIETDSLLVSKWISNGNHGIPWLFRTVILDCQTLLQQWKKISVGFSNRKTNVAAHSLAKYALSAGMQRSWREEELPWEIRLILLREGKMGLSEALHAI